jgi:hypothetical protein
VLSLQMAGMVKAEGQDCLKHSVHFSCQVSRSRSLTPAGLSGQLLSWLLDTGWSCRMGYARAHPMFFNP